MAGVMYHRVSKFVELSPGERLSIKVSGQPIVIFNIDGGVFAIDDACTHDDGPLGDWEVEDDQIICPRQGTRFDIRSGEVLSLPEVSDVPTYPPRVVDGVIGIDH